MKSRVFFSGSAACFGAILLVIAGLSVRGDARQKMKPEELVEKHLASIGTAEARAAARNRTVKGAAIVVFRPGPENRTTGNGVFVSEAKSVRLGLLFSALNYPGEDLAYDGNKFATGYVRPGVRSQLSEFVIAHDQLLKEGLMGGTLTTAWALLDVPGRQPRLEYNGLKKRSGKEYHELRYMARKGGGDIRMLMYFDPQTFRHVQTEYRFVRMGQVEIRYTLTEEFADFDVADSLTLPRGYKLRFTVEETAVNLMIDWSVAFDQIQHNQQLDPKTFILQ